MFISRKKNTVESDIKIRHDDLYLLDMRELHGKLSNIYHSLRLLLQGTPQKWNNINTLISKSCDEWPTTSVIVRMLKERILSNIFPWLRETETDIFEILLDWSLNVDSLEQTQNVSNIRLLYMPSLRNSQIKKSPTCIMMPVVWRYVVASSHQQRVALPPCVSTQMYGIFRQKMH